MGIVLFGHINVLASIFIGEGSIRNGVKPVGFGLLCVTKTLRSYSRNRSADEKA